MRLTLLVLLLVFSKTWVIANLADSTQIKNGQELFESNCTACHNFKMDGIGPQLSGLKGVLTPTWMASFIKNPQAKIDEKDARALSQQKKFKTMMPTFDYLTDTEIQDLVAFILTKENPNKQIRKYRQPNF